MKSLKILQPENDSLGAQIKELLKFIDKINKYEEEKNLEIDISEVKHLFPVQILPITSIINSLIENNKSIFIKSSDEQDLFNSIKFYNGFNIDLLADWKAELDYYRDKKNLPIIVIPTKLSELVEKKRNDLISEILNLITKQLMFDHIFQTPLYYLVTEAIDNICEHANVLNGWIMFKTTDDNKYLDICICDSGISILGSYKLNKKAGIETDVDAIKEALNGLSTKKVENGRGFGINTSRKMIVNGLKGIYFLYSGSAMYLKTNKEENISPLPKKYKWNGTIIGMRIPLNIPKKFDFYKYI